MDVALIDSGIWCDGRLKDKIAGKIEFVSEEKAKAESNFMPVHGTTCAEIIDSICPDVQFWDLRIIYQDGKTKISILLEALDWCALNGIKLIHMSLGTIDYFDIVPLEKQIKKLTAQGSIIVAAYHNSDIRTYPAAFPGVFGVRQECYGILSENQFLIQKQQGFNSENSIVAHWWGEDGKNRANSYAAPVITGKIADFLNKNPEAEFDEVLDFLQKGAVQDKKYPDYIETVIRKNKEIEIPVIASRGLYQHEIQQLTDLFTAREYQTLLLQECHMDARAIPIGHYCGKGVSLTNILYTVNAVYQPDVILIDFVSDERGYAAKQEGIDVSIFYKDNAYKICAEGLIGTTKEPAEICDIICYYFE